MSGRVRTRIGAGLLTLVTVVTTAGCGVGPLPGGDRDERPYRVAGQSLTAAEFRYGVAPRRHDEVTFHPDVVLVGGGARAVHSVTADGMTWTLDADADGVAELAPGRIMFVTSRGVGRVVDLRRDDDRVAVTIAPVGITDIIRDGIFSSDQPIPLDDVITYSSAGARWTEETPVPTVTPATYQMPADGRPVPVRAADQPVRMEQPRDGSGQGGLMLARAPAPREERVVQPEPTHGVPKRINTNGLDIEPICCRHGIGAHLTLDEPGLRLNASALLVMNRPSARFHLAISGSRVTVAELQVHGATGLRLDIAGATRLGADRQFERVFTVPLDFSVPVGLILGIPFTLTATQELKVTTAFSARDGNIKASGGYTLGGTLGFGYRDGSWGMHKVDGPVLKESLLDSIQGVSVGANGVVLAYKTNFSLGVGALGFRAGLNFGFTISTGVTRGSALVQFFPLGPGVRGIDCRGATLAIDGTYNVGYSIPEPVAAVINFFLRVFRAKPIAASDGIPNPPGKYHFFDRTQYEPQGCE